MISSHAAAAADSNNLVTGGATSDERVLQDVLGELAVADATLEVVQECPVILEQRRERRIVRHGFRGTHVNQYMDGVMDWRRRVRLALQSALTT